MGSMFSAPSTPAPPPPPPAPPERDDAEIQRNAAEERRRFQNMQGRASTILTSGQGDTSDASVAVKTLLGS